MTAKTRAQLNHRLRNTLQIISGNAQLIEMDVSTSEASRQKARVIIEQCDELVGDIDGLLRVA
jgi:nitrogen-specific signal transduction histidine kinase